MAHEHDWLVHKAFAALIEHLSRRRVTARDARDLGSAARVPGTTPSPSGRGAARPCAPRAVPRSTCVATSTSTSTSTGRHTRVVRPPRNRVFHRSPQRILFARRAKAVQVDGLTHVQCEVDAIEARGWMRRVVPVRTHLRVHLLAERVRANVHGRLRAHRRRPRAAASPPRAAASRQFSVAPPFLTPSDPSGRRHGGRRR